MFLVLLTLVAAASASAQGDVAVQWDGERLGVIAEEVPLAEVIKEVARQTGLETRGLEALEEPISVSFSGLALRDGLQRLLARVSYVFVKESTAVGRARAGVVLILEQRAALPERGSFRQEDGPAESVVGAGTPPGGERVGAEGEPGAEGDPASRLVELQTFANLGDQESLAQGVGDRDQMFQATAVEILAARDPDQAVTALVAATKSDTAETRFHALRLLDQRGEADDRTLRAMFVEALADTDMAVKVYAMQALVERGDPDAQQALHRALRDPDVSVRLFALESLARQDYGRALLEEALSDSDESVRSLAASTLQQTDPQRR